MVAIWFWKPCPECGTSERIDRSAEIRDSITIVDLTAALVRRDSIGRIKDSLIAARPSVQTRLDHGTRVLALAPDDSIGAILDGKPVAKY